VGPGSHYHDPPHGLTLAGERGLIGASASTVFSALWGTSAAPFVFLLHGEEKKEVRMWIKTSVAALGIVGVLAAATPTPTLAQGVHIGPGGVGVDIGRPGWRERHYRAYHGYAYERGRGCRTVTIHRDDGSMKQIRRCD
jgi:hypothetical protein